MPSRKLTWEQWKERFYLVCLLVTPGDDQGLLWLLSLLEGLQYNLGVEFNQRSNLGALCARQKSSPLYYISLTLI